MGQLDALNDEIRLPIAISGVKLNAVIYLTAIYGPALTILLVFRRSYGGPNRPGVVHGFPQSTISR